MQNKVGSIVEKNLLLVNLMKRAGFVAYPVLISTRDHSRLIVNSVQTQQFNRVICGVEFEGDLVLCDTEEPYCPFGILPYQDCNEDGLLISSESGKIIPIRTKKVDNSRFVETTAKINEKGDYTAESKIIYNGYYAISQRSRLSSGENNKYYSELLEHLGSSVTIDTCICTGLDNLDEDLEIVVKYKYQNSHKLEMSICILKCHYFTDRIITLLPGKNEPIRLIIILHARTGKK